MLLLLSAVRRRAQAGRNAWKEGTGDATRGYLEIIQTN